MKIRTIFLLALSIVMLLIVSSIHAQRPYFLDKKGMKASFVDKDAKSKTTGYSELTINEIQGNAENGTVTYMMQIMDAKYKPILDEPLIMKVQIKNGSVSFDPSTQLGKVLKGMTVTGDNMIIPSNISIGDIIKDYSLTTSLGAIKTVTLFSNVKASGKETLIISNKPIECIIIENDIVTKIIGFEQKMHQKAWYGRGIGIVKSENYDKEGKLVATHQLTEIINY